jgi:hypothetical protein
VEITSARVTVLAVADVDPGMRDGCVSVTHCRGDLPEAEADPRLLGTSTSRLLSVDEVFDPVSSQPRMSSLPARVRRPGAVALLHVGTVGGNEDG